MVRTLGVAPQCPSPTGVTTGCRTRSKSLSMARCGPNTRRTRENHILPTIAWACLGALEAAWTPAPLPSRPGWGGGGDHERTQGHCEDQRGLSGICVDALSLEGPTPLPPPRPPPTSPLPLWWSAEGGAGGEWRSWRPRGPVLMAWACPSRMLPIPLETDLGLFGSEWSVPF